MFAMSRFFFSTEALRLAFTEGLSKLHDDVMIMMAIVNKQYISESEFTRQKASVKKS